jgi:6-phosphogluconate dehydrogenase (decarboxylating)
MGGSGIRGGLIGVFRGKKIMIGGVDEVIQDRKMMNVMA